MPDPSWIDARGLPRPEIPVPVESVPCPVCGGNAFDPTISDARDWIWRKPGSFDVATCRGCGTGVTRPRPTAAGLAFYYDDTYAAAEGERVVDGARFYDSRLGGWLIDARLRTLARGGAPLASSDRLCDVGCSHGYFVAAARRISGCTAAGCDLSAGSVAAARDRDVIDYRAGRLVDVAFDAGAFTVVSFIECLEHEVDPAEALAEAFRLLEPGGRLLIEVPNFRSPWRRLFGAAWLPLLVPQHCTHFTPTSLARLVRQAGFEVVHQQGMFFPLELTISAIVALARVLGVPGPDSHPLRRLVDAFNALWLVALFVVVDVPTQAALAALNRSGHQALVARRP